MRGWSSGKWLTLCARGVTGVLMAFSHSPNLCSMAMLTHCSSIFPVEGVLNEECIFRGILNLQICIKLCLESFF